MRPLELSALKPRLAKQKMVGFVVKSREVIGDRKDK
jgi:hypothetical protein